MNLLGDLGGDYTELGGTITRDDDSRFQFKGTVTRELCNYAS